MSVGRAEQLLRKQQIDAFANVCELFFLFNDDFAKYLVSELQIIATDNPSNNKHNINVVTINKPSRLINLKIYGDEASIEHELNKLGIVEYTFTDPEMLPLYLDLIDRKRVEYHKVIEINQKQELFALIRQNVTQQENFKQEKRRLQLNELNSQQPKETEIMMDNTDLNNMNGQYNSGTVLTQSEVHFHFQPLKDVEVNEKCDQLAVFSKKHKTNIGAHPFMKGLRKILTKQIYQSTLCEWAFNDAVLTQGGPDFLVDAVTLLTSVLVMQTSLDGNFDANADDGVERVWILSGDFTDSHLNKLIKVLPNDSDLVGRSSGTITFGNRRRISFGITSPSDDRYSTSIFKKIFGLCDCCQLASRGEKHV